MKKQTRKKTPFLKWRAPEYPYHEKSLIWFWGALGVLLLLVAYGIATDGWTFSVALLVFAGTYYLVHRNAPSLVEVEVSDLGVKIGRHAFPYSSIKGFWVLYEPPVKRLYLRMEGKFRPDVFVSLEESDPAEVRDALLENIPELRGMQEPFADTLIRLLRL